MFDMKSPLAKKIREQLSDEQVRKRVYDYALWRAGNAWDAKDLVAEALAWSCDPARKPWDSEKRLTLDFPRLEPDALRHCPCA
jgi:hypothetical protein